MTFHHDKKERIAQQISKLGRRGAGIRHILRAIHAETDDFTHIIIFGQLNYLFIWHIKPRFEGESRASGGCTIPVMKSSYFTNYTPFVHENIHGFMKY